MQFSTNAQALAVFLTVHGHTRCPVHLDVHSALIFIVST